MIEVVGNLWTYKTPDGRDPDCRVITTNGTFKKNGEAVMGRGCALEAKQRFPDIARLLGDGLKRRGNIVQFLKQYDDGMVRWDLVSFPVKHNWHETADIRLIGKSAAVLVVWANLHGWQTVVIPRPGCGNGGLRWEDVRKVIQSILDDRFVVITFA